MDDPKSETNRIIYRVEKISKDFDTLTLEEHVTVCNMLQQMLQFRVADFQKKEQARALESKAEADRLAKFDPRPLPRPAIVQP
jgi:hypothetical protein